MKLVHLLSHKVVIARLSTESGDKLMFTTVTTEMGHIQPMDGNKNQISDGVFGKSYRMYFDGDTDIQEGDILRDTNSKYYRVKTDGVSRRTFGSFDYLIVLLEKTSP